VSFSDTSKRLARTGRTLLVHAEAVLARLDEAQQELGEIAGLRRGRLRLASFPAAIATLVPRAIALFNPGDLAGETWIGGTAARD
jgi:DNA-binding transcriptional LysR family regulator